jgi:hypothetical protein
VSYDSGYPAAPNLQIVTRPGGLSSTAHVVNVIAVLISCGLWLPIYVLMWLAAPMKRVDVIAPAGTPLTAIEAARAQALQLTPEELVVVKSRRRAILILFLVIPAIIAVLVVIGATGH